MKRILRSLLLLLLGGAVFCAVLYHIGVEGLGKLLDVRLLPVVLAVGATCCMVLIISMRWRILVAATGGKTVSWWQFVRCCATTAFLGRIIPKDLADIGGRTYWLRQTGTRNGLSASNSVVIDRGCDVLVLLCFLPWSLLALTEIITLPIAFLGCLGSMMLAGLSLIVFRKTLFALVGRGITALANMAIRLPFISREAPTPLILTTPKAGPLAAAIALSVLKSVTMAFQYYFYSQAFGLELPTSVLVLGIPVCQVAFMFSFTAGGLGVLEAGWLGVFSLAGVASPDVGAFILGQRILDIVCIAFVAALVHLLSFLTRTE